VCTSLHTPRWASFRADIPYAEFVSAALFGLFKAVRTHDPFIPGVKDQYVPARPYLMRGIIWGLNKILEHHKTIIVTP
jgi:hypothetical protein